MSHRTFTREELLALAGKDDSRCQNCARPVMTRKDRAQHMVETDTDDNEPCPRRSDHRGDGCWCEKKCWSEFYCSKDLKDEVAMFALSLMKGTPK